MLNLTLSPMVKGVLIGVGVSAVGFYAYKHNGGEGWTTSCAVTA